MKIFIILLLMSSIAYAQTPEVTPEPFLHSAYVPDGYALVFHDEFEDEGVDLNRWMHRYVDRVYGAGFNIEDAIEQTGDGFLRLVTTADQDQVYTGMIQSREEFQYGYFEARIKFQQLQGHHGAFWLQSRFYGQYVGDPARSGAEIDIIEFFGDGRPHAEGRQNVYWNPYADKETRTFEVNYRAEHGEELSADFHVFGLLWTEDGYQFFIDGVASEPINEGISHIPEYIVLSLSTSEWEHDRLQRDQLPDEMLVDYVRVYALEGE